MSEKLSGWEAFILWALLAVGGGRFRAEMDKAKLLPKNDKALFDGLSRSGLITKERRGTKGFWIELTDKGWDTAGKNLSAALPPTRKASAVLQAWLTHLQAFMQARGFVLADILSPVGSPIQVNIQIRTFAKLREMLATHTGPRQKIEDMERRYDKQFKVVFDVLQRLLTEKEKAPRQIGFHRGIVGQ